MEQSSSLQSPATSGATVPVGPLVTVDVELPWDPRINCCIPVVRGVLVGPHPVHLLGMTTCCPPLRAACAACPGPTAGTSPALSLSLSLSLSAAEEERPGPTRTGAAGGVRPPTHEERGEPEGAEHSK